MAALRALAACLILASLAGCISDGTPGTSDAPEAAGQVREPQEGSAEDRDEESSRDGEEDPAPAPSTAQAAGAAEACDAPSTHGEPERDDGTVDTAPEG